jgi:hypothetical protein
MFYNNNNNNNNNGLGKVGLLPLKFGLNHTLHICFLFVVVVVVGEGAV